MACVIKDVKDPYLKSLVSQYGDTDGMGKYFSEVGEVLSKFNIEDSISGKDFKELMRNLSEYNALNGTNHQYNIDKNSISDNAKYSPKLSLDFNLENKYNFPAVSNNAPLFDDEGNMNELPLDPSELQFDGFEDFMEPREDFGDFPYEDDPSLAYEQAMQAEAAEMKAQESEAKAEKAMADEAKYFSFNDVFLSMDDLIGDMNQFQSMANIDVANGVSIVAAEMRTKLKDIVEIIAKLNNNIKTIEASQLSELKKDNPDKDKIDADSKRILSIKSKIEKYRDDFDVISNSIITALKEKTTTSLLALYNTHAKWISSIVNQSNPSASELKGAWKATEIWRNASSIFSDVNQDDEIRNCLRDIENLANNAEFNKLELLAQKQIADISKNSFGINISEREMKSTSDISPWTRMARTLGNISKPIVAVIDHMIRRANYNTHLEEVELKSVVKDMFKKAKSSGIDPKVLFSTDENGKWDGNLLGRIAKAFYDVRDSIDLSFSNAINLANSTVNQQKKWSRLKDAVNTKNQQLRSSVYVINPAEVSTNKDKVLEKLIQITGDKDYANDLIARAMLKYENWSSLHEFMISEGKKTKEEIQAWKNKTSAVEYINYIAKKDVGNDIRLFNDIENYAVEVPLREHAGKDTGFYDKKFNDKILSNKATLNFYNEYHDTLGKYLGYLPSHLIKNLGEYFLPNIKKSMIERVFNDGALGAFSNLSDEVLGSLTTMPNTLSDAHPNSIFPHKSIKVRGLKALDVNEKSDNLQEILVEFGKMAIAHKHLSGVEDKVLLANAIVKNMKEDILNPDGSYARHKITGAIQQEGKGNLTNLQRIIDHTINANIYSEPTDPGKPSKFKVYDKKKKSIKIIGSANPIPIFGEYEKLAKTEGYDKAAQIISEHPDYGKHVLLVNEKDAAKEIELKLRQIKDKYEDGDLDVNKYNQLKSSYEETLSRMGKHIVPSKIGDMFISMGALKSFSYNPLPVIANLGFGFLQMMSHAAGAQDFTTSQAFSGVRAAVSSVLQTINDESIVNNKLYNLCMKLHLIPDLMDNMSRSTMNILTPFGMLSSSDYILRAATLHSMLSSTKIKDLSGKERSLLDAFNNDGSWNTAEFGAREEWNASYDSEAGNKELFGFANNVKRVNQILHGNMDSEMPFEMKRDLVGRFITQYRLSWLADGIDARWGEKRYDYIAGRNIEGTYITTGKFIKEQGIAKTLGVALRLMVGQGEAAFSNVKISEEDRKMIVGNIRKQMQEIYIYAAMLGTYFLIKSQVDDDDEDQKFNYTAINMLNRVMTDATFYISPQSFQQITNNVVPALGIIQDFYRFNSTVFKHFMGDEYYTNEIVFKSATRMFPMLNLYNKFDYTTSREL